MSRNSFDEGDDKITPLARTMTGTDEGNRVLQMGNMAAARRKNSIHRSSTTGGNNTHRNPSPADEHKVTFSRSNTTGGNNNSNNNNNKPFSRSKSVREVLSRARSTKEPHREHNIPNKGFAPSRSKSLRAPPPPRLQMRRNADGKMGTTEVPVVPDFPSPGRAPTGQRIFDPQTVAEEEGVEIEKEGGWALDKRTQKKLDEERQRIEELGRLHGYAGEDGDIKPTRNARQRSKSFKDYFRRS